MPYYLPLNCAYLFLETAYSELYLAYDKTNLKMMTMILSKSETSGQQMSNDFFIKHSLATKRQKIKDLLLYPLFLPASASGKKRK
jgi:hypothetical protein